MERKERKEEEKKGRKKKKDGEGLARDTHIKHTLKCRHTVNSEQ